jgi:hypothetical protein
MSTNEAEVVTRSPQSLIREWLAREISGSPQVSLGDLLPLARERFGNDSEFREALIAFSLPMLVDTALQQVMLGNRRFTKTGVAYTTPEEIERLKNVQLAQWYESASYSVHAPILRMTAPELDYAIGQRHKRAATELQRAAFLQELRDGLPDDETRVEDHYSDEQLAAIYSKHF